MRWIGYAVAVVALFAGIASFVGYAHSVQASETGIKAIENAPSGMGGMMHSAEMEELHEKFEKGEIEKDEFITEMAKEMAEHWEEMPCHR